MTILAIYYSDNSELEAFKADNKDLLKSLKVIYAHNSAYGEIRVEVVPLDLD